MIPLLASSVGGDVHAVSHSQAQEHPPAVGIDDLPVDGEHQQRYQRKHPQPHEQNESHRAEDVLVTDSSMLERPAIGEAPVAQESASRATALRERACRDILVRVNADSGQEVTACQCSDALPLAHTVFTDKIGRGQRPGHDHRRDVHRQVAGGADGQWPLAGCGRGQSIDADAGSGANIRPRRERVIWLV